MSWGKWPEAKTPSESTRRTTRPARLYYEPPHLRSGRARPDTSIFPSEPARPHPLDPTGPDPIHGLGRRTFPIRNTMSSFRPNPSHNDSTVTFDGLEKSEDLGLGFEDDVINFDAYEDIPVEVSGQDVPGHVDAFSELQLGSGLTRNVERCKYVKPTPIQRHAIPILIAGRDLMACAQTGSGKTAAFCLPIIFGVLESRGSGESDGGVGGRVASPKALVLSPTRELTCQIYEEAKKFAYQTDVKIVVAYGGASISQQFHELSKGVDVLVATPGRLADMIERGRVSLRKVKYLALDEADRMLDMGFEPQIRKIVKTTGMSPPGQRQTMLFSATFPDEIQILASDFLSNYIFLSVGRVGSSTDLIAQKVEQVKDMDKRDHLVNLLRAQADAAHGKLALTLIFVETKRGADVLEHWLSDNGFPATAIHGDKIQLEREQALRSFKTGVCPILVATDVASRGLDIPRVAHVINFDLPRNINNYVHRIGRTGRAGKSGLATAFFSDHNMPLAKPLVELMKESNQDIPSWLSEYAEAECYSSNHSSRQQGRGGSRFGGCDYRSDYQPENKEYHSSYSDAYSNFDSGTVSNDGWNDDGTGYSAHANGTGSGAYSNFDSGTVSNDGWNDDGPGYGADATGSGVDNNASNVFLTGFESIVASGWD